MLRKMCLPVMMVLLVSGTLFAGGQKEAADGQVKLTVLAPWADQELESFMPVLTAYEEANPGVTIEYRTGKPEDTATILAGQFAVKRTPADLIDTSFSWYIREQGEKGHLMDVSGLVSDADFLPGALDMVKVSGVPYGAPSVGGVTITEYRKSFFREKNLPDPASLGSWDEYLALLDKIQLIPGVDGAIGSGGGVGWTFTSIIETYIITFGGVEMHKALTEGTMKWTDPSVRNIFVERLLPMLQKGYFGEPDEFDAVLKAMWNGKHGMYVGDSTDNLMLSPAEDRGVFLLPGQKGTILWNDFWFAPKYSENPEEAQKLFTFLATEGQVMQIKGGGRIATYAKVPVDAYPASEREVFSVIRNAAVRPDMDDTIGGKFQSVIWDQLGLIWSKPDVTTLDRVLDEIQKASDDTLDK